jgi:hypothetical protein
MPGTEKDSFHLAHGDFTIGMEFATAAGKWRVTDVGTRTIVAIKVDPQGERDGWLDGPPYAVAEVVFDEDDLMGELFRA